MDYAGHLKVLIVEDDPIVAMDEAEIVRSFGHEVVGVAAEARTSFEIAERDSPTIALLDVNLADGATGPMIAATLIRRHMLVVFITANPELLPANFAGALGCIEKPYVASTLGAALSFAHRFSIDGLTREAPKGLLIAPGGACLH